MQIIISPAKSLDFESSIPVQTKSTYRFTKEPIEITKELKKKSPKDLGELMKISQKLSDLNFDRFQTWHFPFDDKEARQALFAFKGDVYTGMDAYSLDKKEIDQAQKQLRILSGLYGLLKPLDLILPYRLEMGTKLTVKDKKNLYEFWGSKITSQLNADIKENSYKYLINLASNEYYKSLQPKDIQVPIISPEFKDLKNGQYKIISFYAKKARGLMTRFIVQNQLRDPNDLKAFDAEGYYYNNQLSKGNKPVFTRDH